MCSCRDGFLTTALRQQGTQKQHREITVAAPRYDTGSVVHAMAGATKLTTWPTEIPQNALESDVEKPHDHSRQWFRRQRRSHCAGVWLIA